MHIARSGLVLGVLALTLASTVVSAQPTAEKPIFKVGDRWVFSMVEGDKTSRWSREVVEVRQDGLSVKFGNGTVSPYDDAMNFVDPQGLDNSRILARYPLKIGAEWKFTRRPGQTRQSEERGSAKIVGYEQITVPAGTFACFHVDAEAVTTYRAYSEQRSWNRWYCPAIKWIAKERVEVHIFNPYALPSSSVPSPSLRNIRRDNNAASLQANSSRLGPTFGAEARGVSSSRHWRATAAASHTGAVSFHREQQCNRVVRCRPSACTPSRARISRLGRMPTSTALADGQLADIVAIANTALAGDAECLHRQDIGRLVAASVDTSN